MSQTQKTVGNSVAVAASSQLRQDEFKVTDKTIVKLIAEHVMEWTDRWCDCEGDRHMPIDGFMAWHDKDGDLITSSETDLSIDESGWNPLEDDTAACAVRDKMVADGWTFDMHGDASGWMVGFVLEMQDSPCWASYSNPDSRRAICVAALKAVGVWKDQSVS
jgi:hypothetical protein